MKKITQFVQSCQSQLKPILGESGNVLYSAAKTLQPGSVYLLGLNPGGDPRGIKQTVGESLDLLTSKTSNAFLDESWRIKGKDLEPGKATLQKRIDWLLTSLDVRTRAVCASNLIFKRTSRASEIDYPALADLCWPVHAEILNMVNPRLIICFGNSGKSPYQYLRMRLSGEDQKPFPSGHGSWLIRSFESSQGFKIVGLPHLSRYAINKHSTVLEYIKQ